MRTVRSYAPGRTELAGNHTDHQGGRVIAAAVDCGVEVVMKPNGTNVVHVESAGFPAVDFDVRDLAPQLEERFSTAALVRGVCAGVRDVGIEVEGFDMIITSTVPPGSGLSSSAAFELAIAAALFGCERALDPVTLAKIGQAAERDYFGKPCGLMDQLAVALGGVAAIDFADEKAPAIERIDFTFSQSGHALCIIDTHCDHSQYTDEYAQVALDMFDVARLLGAETLSRVPEEVFLDRLEYVRSELGDVPALRALHYYHENKLVDARAQALREGDMGAFIDYMRRSAASSAAYLQNVSTADRHSQPAMVALALADVLLESEGAARIHGGGFGGTIQAIVPEGRVESFVREMDAHLGAGSCRRFEISREGAYVQCL